MAKRQFPSPPNLHRMNPFGGASVPVKPPEKGSFPLDRAGQVSQRGRGVWKEEEVDAYMDVWMWQARVGRFLAISS